MLAVWSSALLFFLGAIFGSFLNVVISRTLAGKSWVKGRSECDHCAHQLAWYDNIPLLSFLVLNGKCRYCRKKIDPTHLLLEVLTGLLFVWWWWVGFLFFKLSQQPLTLLQPLFWLSIGMILLVIVVADLKKMIIPNGAVILLTVLTLAYRLILIKSGVMQPADWWASLMASLAVGGFFFGLWFFTKGKGMGFGDVKLVVPLGLLLGWPRILVSFQLAFIIGAVVGVALILLGKHKLKKPIPFGPFLILGTVIGLVWGHQLTDWYLTLMGF
ncbi:MAG: prepilin peptidase [Patescibacteria group bacterium]|nr:prepilin peptidase [Patescibacteria group bacterium]